MAKYRIDLRSDTQTEPTPEMREAMARAEVGDDQYGEDPTVIELEETTADMFGTEAALFVASGTMGNLVSLLTISQRGDTLLIDPYSHAAIGEAGGYATVAGCTLLPIETGGVLTAEHVRAHLSPVTTHSLQPAIIWAENTHNRRGGVAWGPGVMRGLVEVATEHGLKIHLDAARIFNAAAALDVPVEDLVEGADTVQICLSKGLGAPFGSLIVASRDVIERARRIRQMMGGGMRQGGVMAAAGLIGLRYMPARMADDHQHARQLGAVLEDIEGIELECPVYTNLVYLRLDGELIDGAAFAEGAQQRGLGVGAPRPGNIMRLVTHHQVSDADIEEAADILVGSAEAARVGA